MSETHDWSVATIEGISLPEVWIVVSSASISHLPGNICRGRSLMLIENKRGPKTDPCGTPDTTGLTSDC